MSVKEETTEACDIANQDAGNGPGWNVRFLASLHRQGFDIITMPKGLVGDDLPIIAPKPMPHDPSPWVYPSLIVRKGWKPE